MSDVQPPVDPQAGDNDLVLVTDSDDARILRLNRPAVRNALSTAVLAELIDQLGAAIAEEGVRVIVLTGAGAAFSAGADLREDLDHDGQVRRMELFCNAYEATASCPKPVIAAVEGHCVGGGVEIAAAADLRVADPSARFRFPGAALGVPVGAAKLVELMGLGNAKDLVFTARTFDAGEAYRLGFVQRLTEPDGALEEALELATRIAANNPEALAYLKRQFARFSGLGDHVAAENDALLALAEAGGDIAALNARDPRAAWLAGEG